jgi:hypothetical protein
LPAPALELLPAWAGVMTRACLMFAAAGLIWVAVYGMIWLKAVSMMLN